jgi:Ni,Fe-hydrogenase III large subunit/Ni,Fe-hydrogenase III component G
MPIPGLELALQTLPAPLPAWRGEVDADGWLRAARRVAETGGRLVSLWGTDRRAGGGGRLLACAAYAVQDGLVWLELALDPAKPVYPDLSDIFPAAARMQRAAADLSGIAAEGAGDLRPWLNHGAWPRDYVPLRHDADGDARFPHSDPVDYPFVRVEGEGVHEIAVGPVHAGIIEPGHFRFSVVGEKVLRLEERLGYTHKGIDQRFTRTPPLAGHTLAGRISGDSTVAFSWSYCMALESAWSVAIPQRAQWLRALFLERERVANHLGDLGALGNDAALAFGLAQFSRLKEDWLRLQRSLFGHRYLMDAVVPGGVVADLAADGAARLLAQCDVIEGEVRTLKAIYDEHAGLQDRFLTTGRVEPKLAARLGLTGLAGRASGQSFDLRADHPVAPYDRLGCNMATHRAGDVAARVTVRFEEVFESLRLIRSMVDSLPDGPYRVAIVPSEGEAFGAGWVEGWRGEVLVALELEQGRIRRAHAHDPSWHNWPVLEHAVMGNIVPDFPLINKSFNLSYSGHDR